MLEGEQGLDHDLSCKLHEGNRKLMMKSNVCSRKITAVGL